MNLYWVYDLPTWLFALLTIAVTVAVGLAGFYSTRKWVRRIHGEDHSHNDVVGFYLGAVCVFYGITLGLLAVATWQTFTDVETRVGQEAAAAGVLYRDGCCRRNDGWGNARPTFTRNNRRPQRGFQVE